jgi:hypothetical protein
MVRESDPKAEKIKQRKARKGESRYTTHSTLDAVKLILRTRSAVQSTVPAADEDCPHCLDIQRQTIAA